MVGFLVRKKSDAINRSLQRVEALRSAVLQSVENVRGFHNESYRVEIADSIARTYDEVIRILREERTKP